MKSIGIIMLPVKDQQKAKAFYLQLGFNVIAEAPMPNGETWMQMGLPGSETTISLAAFHGVICKTTDIEKEVITLKEKGIELGKFDNTPWGKFAWLKDEDGNSICLHQQ